MTANVSIPDDLHQQLRERAAKFTPLLMNLLFP